MTTKNITDHYKKYGVIEGDKLLLETAKNNYQKGYADGTTKVKIGCEKMFQPFLSSDEFYNDEETFWKCGDLWNNKPLLCPECRNKGCGKEFVGINDKGKKIKAFCIGKDKIGDFRCPECRARDKR